MTPKDLFSKPMKWKIHKNQNRWKVNFAFLPMNIKGYKIWFEPYIYRKSGLRGLEFDFYEGCAERVGYPCDCFRHDK